jgi:Protein of unknown function (DUF3289)
MGLAVNDVWGYDVKITKFVLDKTKKTFSASFDFELFDHFGIDSKDVLEYSNYVMFKYWFLLQRKYGCKPFLTTMKFSKNINGSY